METLPVDFPRDLINIFIFKIREKEFPHKIAKVSIWEMREILAQRKFPLNYYKEDLETDIKTLKKVHK